MKIRTKLAFTGLILALMVLGIVLGTKTLTRRDLVDLGATSIPGAYYLQHTKNPVKERYWAYVILEMTGNPDLVKIAWCESNLNPDSKGDKNSSGIFLARGLFQFHNIFQFF